MLVNMIAKTPDSLPTKAKAAHVIVLGNEKGGSGKSTIAMHLAVALLKAGWRVATIDTDSRQQSLTHYVENRRRTSAILERPLELPSHFAVPLADGDRLRDVEDREFRAFAEVIGRAGREADFVIIDTPGNNSYLMRLSHGMADTLVTPLNDSFVDLDVVGRSDPNASAVDVVGHYSELVRVARRQRAAVDGKPIDWVVVRNRLSALATRNQRTLIADLRALGAGLDFRLAAGISERVVFRELFLVGLTALDLLDRKTLGARPTMSHVSARREIRELVARLNLPQGRATAAPRLSQSVRGMPVAAGVPAN